MVCEIRHLSYDVWQEWTALVTVMVCEIRHLSYDVWQEWTALIQIGDEVQSEMTTYFCEISEDVSAIVGYGGEVESETAAYFVKLVKSLFQSDGWIWLSSCLAC
ncbi:hypothetical protein Hdeb2414_s0001g00023721 [Helianthus debilis subsp. tardiflorus]